MVVRFPRSGPRSNRDCLPWAHKKRSPGLRRQSPRLPRIGTNALVSGDHYRDYATAYAEAPEESSPDSFVDEVLRRHGQEER